jgi:hypothetical protein
MDNGEMGKAVAASSPKVLRDFIKAYDLTEGGVQAGGKTILQPEDISIYDIALQMVGINPADVSLAQETAREVSNLSTTLTARRSRLLHDFTKAQLAGDMDARDEALDAIDAWGSKQPKLAISRKELAGAVKKGLANQAGKLSKKEEIIKEQLMGG